MTTAEKREQHFLNVAAAAIWSGVTWSRRADA